MGLGLDVNRRDYTKDDITLIDMDSGKSFQIEVPMQRTIVLGSIFSIEIEGEKRHYFIDEVHRSISKNKTIYYCQRDEPLVFNVKED